MSSPLATSQNINFGQHILPVKRVEIFTPDEWESFIEEWLDVKKTTYKSVERLAGAGDKGRDVVAKTADDITADHTWDCYQCKHYKNPLTPSDVWVEMGKLIYYTFKKDYSVPRKYYFTAPKGCGTKLSSLLNDPAELKKQFAAAWKDKCEENITVTEKVELNGELLAYFNTFDFSIFTKALIKDIIEEHKKHANHLTRFGGGLPPRPVIDEKDIPATIQKTESTYVNQLLKAYESDCSGQFNDVTELPYNYASHFKRARISFHHAEQLRNLYRDSLPPGTFECFQTEIYDGTVNIFEEIHSNGYAKVKAVELQASLVQISSNPLKDVSIQKDKIGICHQLCNESKYQWIK
ncbi:ABC-three component system protein [Asinibacterium sp. OR53]|uniref:ABC-three component system protein n=1 Tax=Asinibacterium sp. OR53 TaxID=925409 RepID=UPI0004BC03A0|nr:ABC-three component system protein [Asinibacterium sp. OR53]